MSYRVISWTWILKRQVISWQFEQIKSPLNAMLLHILC